jgi:hypothetical protein
VFVPARVKGGGGVIAVAEVGVVLGGGDVARGERTRGERVCGDFVKRRARRVSGGRCGDGTSVSGRLKAMTTSSYRLFSPTLLSPVRGPRLADATRSCSIEGERRSSCRSGERGWGGVDGVGRPDTTELPGLDAGVAGVRAVYGALAVPVGVIMKSLP